MKMYYGGKERNCFPVICLECGIQYFRPKHLIKRTKYCSVECFTRSKTNATEFACAYCSTSFKRNKSKSEISKSGYQFCSRKCKDKAQEIDSGIPIQLEHYDNGIRYYRVKALNNLIPKCVKCGYDKFPAMLDVDHIDSNRENNNINNLQFLCVWCHALKTRNIKDHDR